MQCEVPPGAERLVSGVPPGEGLVVQGLRKRYGDVVALDGADLRVRPGRLVGFLGPNGAGKTTAMRAILRLVSLDGGSITWNGRSIGEEQRRRIGYMPQERGLYLRMSAAEHIAYIGRLGGLGTAAADAAGGGSLRSEPGRVRFEAPAGVDPVRIVAAAGVAGRVATFSIEPPSLDEVFVELVTGKPAGGGQEWTE